MSDTAIIDSTTQTADATTGPGGIDWQPRPRTQYSDSGCLTTSWDYHGTERLCRVQLHVQALDVPPALTERRNEATAALRAQLAIALQADARFVRATSLLRQMATVRTARDIAARRLSELEARRTRLTDDPPENVAKLLRKLDQDISVEQGALDERNAELASLEPLAERARAEAEAGILVVARGLQRRYQQEARERLDQAITALLVAVGDDITNALLLLEETNTALPDASAKGFAARLLDEAADGPGA
jgi:hypothetical protein